MQFDFPAALALTIAVETIACFLLLRSSAPPAKILLAGVFINALTLPLVWSVFPSFIAGYWPSLAVSETCILLLEAALLAAVFRLEVKKALLTSLAANGASFSLGVALALA